MSEARVDQVAERRARWLAGRATGADVLDMGSSEGAAAILLAREGGKVALAERDPAALERTRRRLESEVREVRGRIDVLEDEPDTLAEGSFTVVMIGEALARGAKPDRPLTEAQRVLGPAGLLLIATPYAADPREDREEPAHLRPLLCALEPAFVVEEVEMGEGYLGIAARTRGEASPAERAAAEPWLEVLEIAHRRLADRERAAAELEAELADRDRTADTRQRELERLEERLERMREESGRRSEELRDQLAAKEAELRKATASAREQEERLRRLRASRSFRVVRLLWRVGALARRVRDGGRATTGRQ